MGAVLVHELFSQKAFKVIGLMGVVALLPGCYGLDKGPRQLSPAKVIEDFGGPEVGTVEHSLLTSAKQASEKGEYKKAISLYRQLVDQKPENKQYKIEVAEHLRRFGEFDQAEDLYAQLEASYPDDLQVLEGKAMTMIAVGEYQQALTILDRVIKEDGERWRALNAAGVALTLMGQYEESVEYLRAALKHNGNSPIVLNNLGLTLAAAKRYDRAIKAFEVARKQLPKEDAKRSQIELNQAMVHGIQGDMEAAERLAKQHLDEHEVYNNLGYYAYLGDNPELAKSYLHMALGGSSMHYDKAWENLQKLPSSHN